VNINNAKAKAKAAVIGNTIVISRYGTKYFTRYLLGHHECDADEDADADADLLKLRI
jgi:hypothetical protein